MPSLTKSLQLLRNMGGRYVAFRLTHELKKKTGLFKKQFPQDPPFQSFISLEAWRKQPAKFFFGDRKDVQLGLGGTTVDLPKLRRDFEDLQKGRIPFFSAQKLDLGQDYDWVTNPDSGFRYNARAHWSQINDYSREAGDIKWVWEKARFSFLYTIIRYDAHTGEDHAAWVWQEILSWIKANPINSGPNYKCSQEISLRVLNWSFALHYYKNSESLTEEVFWQILHAIYWQLHHVYHNIDFSRIAVRNNHAITETLTLYLGGLLYPFFPESGVWKQQGKKWFEEEIAYQVYPDGTFLQFSMNYHRVVVQLLTWAIRLAELNGESLQEVVYDRARKSLQFLSSCMIAERGWLPNYGANDGALFFKLNDAHYRDYRPQLQALSTALGIAWKEGDFEDRYWFGTAQGSASADKLIIPEGSHRFDAGGYYLYRNNKSLTFVRCGNHKDRPSQADNLHIDLWYGGQNLLHDAGSYKYNTDEKELRYFMGTRSHNTVMLGDYDQMEKGARFIWYHWSQAEDVKLEEREEFFLFKGCIRAFQHVDAQIRHQRQIKVYKNKPLWEVEDLILNKPATLEMKQLWHTTFPERLSIQASTAEGDVVEPRQQKGYYSSFYGIKESCTEIAFVTRKNKIKTIITVQEA